MIVTRIFSPSPIYILFREENNFEQCNNWNLSILLTLLLLFFLLYYFWIMPPCLDSMFLFNSPFEEITTNITYYSLYSIPAPIEILLLHIFSLSSKRVFIFSPQPASGFFWYNFCMCIHAGSLNENGSRYFLGPAGKNQFFINIIKCPKCPKCPKLVTLLLVFAS